MSLPLQEQEIREVSIENLAYGGDGVAHPEGFTVFVPRTAPGDRVKVKIQTVRKRYARAFPLEILERSPLRIEPKCKYFDDCGGCHYQHLDPSWVSDQKVLHVRAALERIAHESVPVRPLISPQQAWNYRNRLTYHRSLSGKAGYVSWRDYEILDIDDCPIGHIELNALWKQLKERIREVPAEVVPYVVLRRTTVGETAVLLSVCESGLDTAVQAQMKDLAESFEKKTFFYVTKIKAGSRSPFGKSIEALSGPDRLPEKVAGISFSVRPDLFFQVHPEVTEKVVSQILSWSEEVKPKRLIDIYCGAGLFTLALARQGFQTLGVEVGHEAVLCAQESARKNRLDSSANFRGGKAERIIERLIREGEQFDAAVVDPPRKGLQPEVIENLPKLGVRRLLYVSCSPPTFARDVKALKEIGYQINWIQPFDMFPQTYHVETVSSFSL